MNAFAQLRKLVMPLLVFSFVTNLAVLISPLFMMQVLDRVLPSGNIATLALLAFIALAALALQSITEAARDISLGRLSRWSERYGASIALQPDQDSPQSILDKTVCFAAFAGGPTAAVALNIPWIPLVCLALLFVHPSFLLLLGLMVAISVGADFLADMFVKPAEMTAAKIAQEESAILSQASRLQSVSGMQNVAINLRLRFLSQLETRHRHLEGRQTAKGMGAGTSSFIRSSGQILALSVGAYLVTVDRLSPGGMIAASIILSKGYANIEAAIGQFALLRQNYHSFRDLCSVQSAAPQAEVTASGFEGALRVEGVIIPRGGGAPPRVDRLSMQLKPGECLAIVGPAGSGKTSLIDAMSGQAPPPIGSVFYDENEIKGLSVQSQKDSIGYLPQQASLVPGTIADNIAGFDLDRNNSKIIQAAKLAGVHGLIAALPNAYETDLKNDAHLLSAGQRQRLALARALYHDPKYLFLDEPNALLDADGEKALAQTLMRLKENKTTIVMILHRSGIMGLADKVLRLERGRMVDFGDRKDVLSRLGLGGRRIELPILESSLEDLKDWVASQFTRSSDAEFSQKAQVVAAELFCIAQQTETKQTPRIASFAFTFVDDSRCEISMVEELPNNLVKKLSATQEKLGQRDVFLTDLPREEAAFARISKLCERYQVRDTEDATHFTVSLAGDNLGNGERGEWLN